MRPQQDQSASTPAATIAPVVTSSWTRPAEPGNAEALRRALFSRRPARPAGAR